MKHLPVVNQSTDSCPSTCSRRQFTSIASAAAAGFLLTACGPKRLREMVEVINGLAAGTSVVRAGHQKLFPGAKVMPISATAQQN